MRSYVLTEDAEERYLLMLPSLLKLFKNYLRAYPDYYEIRLLLPDGFEDARATLTPIPNVSEAEADTPLFQALRHFEGEVLSRTIVNPDNAEICMQIARPMRLVNLATDDPIGAKPRLRGYLIVTMSLDFLEQQVKTNHIGSSGLIFLINKAGEVLLHRDTVHVGERVAPSLLEKIMVHADTQQHFQATYLDASIINAILSIVISYMPQLNAIVSHSEVAFAHKRTAIAAPWMTDQIAD